MFMMDTSLHSNLLSPMRLPPPLPPLESPGFAVADRQRARPLGQPQTAHFSDGARETSIQFSSILINFYTADTAMKQGTQLKQIRFQKLEIWKNCSLLHACREPPVTLPLCTLTRVTEVALAAPASTQPKQAALTKRKCVLRIGLVTWIWSSFFFASSRQCSTVMLSLGKVPHF